MVRIPRRTHSVSGPPSVHCVFKDVACCCNIVKIQQFYMSVMALRRNPQRKCKREDMPPQATENHAAEWNAEHLLDENLERPQRRPTKVLKSIRRKPLKPLPALENCSDPFPFFDLPREVRDHVYSYLVVRRGHPSPIIEAKSILRDQKKRVSAQRTRERLNLKRAQSGRRPIASRAAVTEPIVHLNVLSASKLLQYEGSDCFYQRNSFAISMDNLPATTVETPSGWDFSRIVKMQLELQLKDAQRTNSYIDWESFFAQFQALRVLRIIPTFHSKFYDWAHSELRDWSGAHYVFRAFFRELLAAIPNRLVLKLGSSADPRDDMHLEGKATVSRRLLWNMYAEMGMRRDIGGSGNFLAISQVVDGEAAETKPPDSDHQV